MLQTRVGEGTGGPRRSHSGRAHAPDWCWGAARGPCRCDGRTHAPDYESDKKLLSKWSAQETQNQKGSGAETPLLLPGARMLTKLTITDTKL